MTYGRYNYGASDYERKQVKTQKEVNTALRAIINSREVITLFELQEHKEENKEENKEDNLILLTTFRGPLTSIERKSIEYNTVKIFQTNGITGVVLEEWYNPSSSRTLKLNMSTQANLQAAIEEIEPGAVITNPAHTLSKAKQDTTGAFRFISDTIQNADFELISFNEDKFDDWNHGQESYDEWKARKGNKLKDFLGEQQEPGVYQEE